ncbi:hypothetical protein M422DRAFT_28664 [Sphaerobolus stellatus SS14]|uniref:WLM-domain-containing protein n=1 Tax=Sphaerobolus stellatus (strain SS14) TaxID=990650 RepID=A0A0C9VVW2_SPHS4|nr:hypothetical protein M422DRAFT_28664 [Sphaerobolus stellatus SS14]
MAANTFVQSFTHLKGKPKAEQALPLLQRIASLVKPIMRKYEWTLPILGEFFPDDERLVGLDINGGQKILLRLRPAWAPDTFYDEEQIVAVMLHELTHNVHGPHDSKFYAFLAKLEDEYDELKRTGYAGEGFHSPGVRVGAGVAHNLPRHLAKQKALEAAEKRRKALETMSGGGRLGGSTKHRTKSPRELAAEAAERRARDEKSCGSGHGIDAEKEAQRAAQNSIVDIIDVDALPDEPQQPPKRERSPDIILLDEDPTSTVKNSRHTVTSTERSVSKLPAANAKSTQAPSKSSIQSGEWTCNLCTLINAPLALQCDACATLRPQSSSGWTCLSCGERGMGHEFWSCRSCGWVKVTS